MSNQHFTKKTGNCRLRSIPKRKIFQIPSFYVPDERAITKEPWDPFNLQQSIMDLASCTRYVRKHNLYLKVLNERLKLEWSAMFGATFNLLTRVGLP